MLKWKSLVILILLIYYLDIFACRRSPYHVYITKNASTKCTNESDCRPWSRCFLGQCIQWMAPGLCWKHWQCRGFRRCVDYTCQAPPVPKNLSARAQYNQSSCHCPEDHVCKRYKCWQTCNTTFECPIGQSCNFMNFCYP